MDELIQKDLLTLYNMLSMGGGEIWLQKIHGRTKTLENKISVTSPVFLQYKNRVEKELTDLKATIADKDKKIKEQENKIKNLKANIADKDKIIEEQEKKIKKLNDRVNQKRLEYADLDALFTDLVIEKDNEISELKEKSTHQSSFKGKGKSVEMPIRLVREVIRLYCMGKSVGAISKETGSSKWQIDRIVNGKLKNEYSKRKIIKSINHLLKVNQNKEFLKKVNEIKTKYQ